MDKATLIERTSRGLAHEWLLFWGHRQKRAGVIDASCLSQWFSAAFDVGGERFATAEHWMMAAKARTFGDDATRRAILAASSPDEAKRLGRKVRGYDDTTWSEVRYALVVEGNVAKFGAHAPLCAYLASTGERVLVEASPYDRVWGIGLAHDAEGARDPTRWRGENLLGFALMEVRDRLCR